MTGSALGGTMKRSRLRKIAISAGAGAIATFATLALNPFSASADPAATTTTVSGPASLATGHPVTFTAAISPSKTTAPVVKATGTVTFTITGRDSSTVSCSGGTNAVALNGSGKAVCKIASGVLVASATPYSVAAAYSGDANFGPSTGSLSQTVSLAASHLKLTYDAKPTSGSATTFTATVTGGGAGSLPTGNVQFSVSAVPAPGNSSLLKCTGGNAQALAPSSDPTPLAEATCVLQAKWFKVPAATKTDPHPTASWTVTASYSGDGNLNGSTATKSGASKV